MEPLYSESAAFDRPELMIRMLHVGNATAFAFARKLWKLCEEVELNLAYRWVCCEVGEL